MKKFLKSRPILYVYHFLLLYSMYKVANINIAILWGLGLILGDNQYKEQENDENYL